MAVAFDAEAWSAPDGFARWFARLGAPLVREGDVWQRLTAIEADRLWAERELARGEGARIVRGNIRWGTVRLTVKPIILTRLADRLGIEEAEVEHMLQEYCGCESDKRDGGFFRCDHWHDEFGDA